MQVITKEDLKRDEQTLAAFLVLFDIALLGVLVLFYINQYSS